jgi:dTDP-D-glucose 4,6-dehydratase
LDQESNFTFYRGDIAKHEDVMDCLRKHDIDTVMHFAAQTHVDLSFGNSNDFTSTNVVGTHVLLECVKLHGVQKFIHVSTDEVYGEVKDDGKDLLEDALLLPTNPYAASKAAAEMYVEAYRKSFQVPAIVVRSNNVYGPHQFPGRSFPNSPCFYNAISNYHCTAMEHTREDISTLVMQPMHSIPSSTKVKLATFTTSAPRMKFPTSHSALCC